MKVVDPPVQFLHGSVIVRTSVVNTVVGTVMERVWEIVWLRYSVVGDGVVTVKVVGWNSVVVNVVEPPVQLLQGAVTVITFSFVVVTISVVITVAVVLKY